MVLLRLTKLKRYVAINADAKEALLGLNKIVQKIVMKNGQMNSRMR